MKTSCLPVLAIILISSIFALFLQAHQASAEIAIPQSLITNNPLPTINITFNKNTSILKNPSPPYRSPIIISLGAGSQSYPVDVEPASATWTTQWQVTPQSALPPSDQDGTQYELRFSASDSYNNIENYTLDFTLDTMAPAVTITPIDNMIITTAAQATIRAQLNEKGNLTSAQLTSGSSTMDVSAAFTRSSDGKTFTFTPQPTPADGPYALSLSFTDLAGNQVTALTHFTIDLSLFTITIDSPPLNASSVSPFRFQVNTSKAANCAYSFFTNQLFANMQPFSSTGGLTSRVDAFTVPPSTNPERTYVLCRDSYGLISPQVSYDLEYDPTPPIITAFGIKPSVGTNPFVINEQLAGAVLEIATDDQTACSYATTPGSNPATAFPPSAGGMYASSHTLPLYNATGIQNNANYTYRVQCTNKAGLPSSILDVNFSVNLQTPAQITIISPPTYTSDKTPLINATTTEAATCKVITDFGTNFSLSPQPPDSRVHSASSATLSDGTYHWSVACTFAIKTASPAPFTFTIDSTPPTNLVIATDNNSCSDSILATFSAQDLGSSASGVASYNVTLKDSTGLILDARTLSGTNPSASLGNGLDPGTYTITATATDRAGNKGTPTNRQVTLYAPDSTKCDTVAPVGSYTQRVSALGVYLNVSCTQSVSGCKPAYTYQFAPVGSSCTPASTATLGTELAPLKNTSVFCFTVSSKNDVTRTYTQTISADATGLQVTLVDPPYNVSWRTPFPVTFATNKAATCKYSRGSGAAGSTYDQMLGAFSITGGTTHTITNFSIVGNLQNPNAETIYVLCKDAQFSLLSPKTSVTLEYDPNAPLITATSVIPNTGTLPYVINEHPDQAELDITTDDLTRCRYSQDNLTDPQPSVPDWTFTRYHALPLGGLIQDGASYTYQVQCENRALNQSATMQVPFSVNLGASADLIITSPARYVTDTTPFVNVTTTESGECSLSIDNGVPVAMQDNGRIHTFQTTTALGESEHRLSVFCRFVGTKTLTSAPYYFIVDTTAPDYPLIITDNVSCSSSLYLEFSGKDNGENASGVQSFNATVKDSTGLILASRLLPAGSASMSVPRTNPTSPTTYTITALAIDKAGNRGPITTRTITTLAPNSTGCDTTPPTVSVDSRTQPTGVSITLTCSDSGSGCANTYLYGVGQTSLACQPTSTKRYDAGAVLVTSTSVFCYTATDNAGNTYSGVLPVFFDNTGIVVTLRYPPLNVSNTNPFNFAVGTNINADCSFALLASVNYPSMSAFITTGGQAHSSSMTLPGSAAQQTYVQCKNANGLLSSRYRYDLSYDPTPPVILGVSVDPNTGAYPSVVNERLENATLSVVTDDLTLCSYSNQAGAAPQTDFPVVPYGDYNTLHRLPLYPGIEDKKNYTYRVVCTNMALDSSGIVDVSFSVDLGAKGLITITSPPAVTSLKRPLINATTSESASCSYLTSPSAAPNALAGTDRTHSATALQDLADGTYAWQIQCTFASPGKTIGPKPFIFTVDTAAPSAPIISGADPSCNPGRLLIQFQSTDPGAYASGVASYNATLLNGSSASANPLAVSASDSLTYTGALIAGASYTVSAYAIDLAGNKGTASTRTFSVLDPNAATCDRTKPTISVDQLPKPQNLTLVTLSCSDSQSGCANTFSFGLAATSASCLPTTTRRYDQGQIPVNKTSILCYTAADLAGNTATGSANILVGRDVGKNTTPGKVIGTPCHSDSECLSNSCIANLCSSPSCSDHIKNGDETAVDCGGSCGACATGQMCTTNTDCASGSCKFATPNPAPGASGTCAAATCSDNIKNQNESDVDCAGPCPACSLGYSCRTSADCSAGECTLGRCAMPGTTPCKIDADCPEGTCSNGVCSATSGSKIGIAGMSLIRIILLALGILLILTGAGYLIYINFMAQKEEAVSSTTTTQARSSPPLLPPRNPLEQQRFSIKQREKAQSRENLLSSFGTAGQSGTGAKPGARDAPTRPGEQRRIPLAQQQAPGTRTAGAGSGNQSAGSKESATGTDSRESATSDDYIDIREIAKRHGASSGQQGASSSTAPSKGELPSSSTPDVFAQLNTIARQQKESKETKETKELKELKETKESKELKEQAAQKQGAGSHAKSHTAAAATPPAAPKSPIDSKTPEPISDPFAALAALTGSTPQETHKLAGKETLTPQEILNLFSITQDNPAQQSHAPISADAFKLILSALLRAKKLHEEDVTNILFEMMDAQMLSKKDVSMILKDLHVMRPLV